MLKWRILFLAPTQTVTRIFPQLRDAGVEVGIADNLKAASAFMRKDMPHLILSYPSLPGYQIEDLLSVGKDDPQFPPVIVFSAQPSPDEATRMLDLGARDYWPEPLEIEKLQQVLAGGIAAPPPPQAQTNASPSASKGGEASIVGSDPSMLRVLALAKRVARSKATVLISGESGTGKEMFSRFLHEHSERATKPFIAVNCAALPEHLLESELFGHEKGAFTGAIARKLGKFELATGGTLLLDEISEMELALQAKLLRVLQEGEIDRVGGTDTVKVDVRVLATTNRNLEDWVQEGKFRQDLFFRLNVIPLRLPSLRERGDDILSLANFFIKMYVREYSLSPIVLSDEAIAWMRNYDWPGNVRELQNLMERAVLLCEGKPITPTHFLLDSDEWSLFEEDGEAHEVFAAGNEQPSFGHPAGEDDTEVPTPSSNGGSAGTGVSADDMFGEGVLPLSEMERIMIKKGLEQTSGNRTQAAELLGISVRTLRNKLNEYRLAGFEIE